jgi:arylsulfatase A-like enzyme
MRKETKDLGKLSMKKYILKASYIAAIIGAVSGLSEACILICQGNNVINRHHFLWVILIYSLTWAISGSILGFLVFLIALMKNCNPPAGKIKAFFISITIFFTLFILFGFNINKKRYLRKEFFTLESMAINLLFILGIMILSFLIYKGLIYIKKSNIYEKHFSRMENKKVKLSLMLLIIVIILIISFYPSQKMKREDLDFNYEKNSSPNVVFILIDALRADHLSCYGYSRKTTPCIDKLAREGTIFTNAFSTAGWTKPTTITIFSSLHAVSHNAYIDAAIIPDNITILPEIFKQNGYKTGIFSSNIFISPQFGFNQGTDYFYTFMPSVLTQHTLGSILRFFGTKTKFFKKPFQLLLKLEQLILCGKVIDTSADGLNKAFIKWIDSLNGKNFFAYLHYMEIHAPYNPPFPYNEMFVTQTFKEDLIKQELRAAMNMRTIKSTIKHMPDALSLNEKKKYLISQYDGEIRYVDSSIGKLIEVLKKRKLLDQTLIIITADHGEEFYEHNNWEHGGRSLFDELIHIPLIMRYPTKLPKRTKVDALVQQVDFLPTMLDICGIPPNKNEMAQGHSILPIFEGSEKAFINRFVVSVSCIPKILIKKAIRDRKNKLIVSNIGGNIELQLFNLINDPKERINIIEANPTIKTYLLQNLEQFIKSLPKYNEFAKSTAIDQETRKRLKALGYIN